MKKTKIIISLALATLVLAASCGTKQGRFSENADTAAARQQAELLGKLDYSVEQPDYNTTYEIFVYSFADSDGDGIGDIKGITEKLDYINDGKPETADDLSANALWLTPVCPSTTYHKYDITDYCDIDSEFGTLEDYKTLLSEAHKRGMKIIFDMVINHTSSAHPWFVSASDYLKSHSGIDFSSMSAIEEAVKACPQIDYYNFLNEKKDGYAKLPGTDYYYEARFWEGMPDLNLDSEKVRAELKEVAEFWLDLGVDGFRMDAVTSYHTGNTTKSVEALKWFCDMARSIKPDTYIVSEAWTNQAEYAKYYEAGIDSTFDFAFAGQSGVIANLARGSEPASTYSKAIAAEEKLYGEESRKSGRGSFLNAPFYTNHDTNRSAGYYTGDDASSMVKLSGALNLLMSGNAYVYYGEELGMKGSGKDENKRAPMAWSLDGADKKDAMLCKGPADMDRSLEYTPYGTYESEKNDAASIYAYYRDLMRIRYLFPVISRGKTEVIDEINSDKVAAFKKTDENGKYQSVSIVINMSSETEKVKLEDNVLSAVLLTGSDSVLKDNNTYLLPPYSVAIFTPKQ